MKKLLLCGIVIAFGLLSHAQDRIVRAANLEIVPIKPSLTDPAITNFDSSHFLYVNRDILVSHKVGLTEDRHQLLLFLPGTQTNVANGGGAGPAEFLGLAANAGYHVICLRYPNSIAAAQVCNTDTNASAFENFRMAIIAGGHSDHLDITRTDSIENRLAKLLEYLSRERADEDWAQFLDKDGAIKWEAIAVAGLSQGGGHAVLIGVKHKVARVISTGGPKDFSHALGHPAAWYQETSATPKDRFFTFNHVKDRVGGCSLEQQMENVRALGLEEFGVAVDTDKISPPYRHARILTTDHAGDKITVREAHVSVVANKNARAFKDVWNYMLTEPVQ